MITWKEFIEQTKENCIGELTDSKNSANPWLLASNWGDFTERVKSSLEDPWDDVEEFDDSLINSITSDLLIDLKPYVKRWVDSYSDDVTGIFDEWRNNFWDLSKLEVTKNTHLFKYDKIS